MNELDEIMSGNGEAVPEATQPQPQTNDIAAGSQPRDDHGRFATQMLANEQIEAGQTHPTADPQAAQNGVPVTAVQAEREKRREAQQEAEVLRREIAELRGAFTAMTQQRQQPETPQQEQRPASLWDDPDSYLKSQLNPVQEQMVQMREFMSENLAIQSHGAETVNAAKAAIEQVARTPEGQNVVRQLMSSRHPFDDLVKWHKQQEAFRRVGNDPDAWLNAEIEKRMGDPTFLAQAIERAKASATANTNRSQPITNLPPSLSRMPGGTNVPTDNDMSDGALFSHATR